MGRGKKEENGPFPGNVADDLLSARYKEKEKQDENKIVLQGGHCECIMYDVNAYAKLDTFVKGAMPLEKKQQV